ncbi:MAG: tetraacyldisaccharide 4'-kinase [Ignavibacteriaceae bacterium]|nr:tetraacyldisaccharide 4'-kinase [Ignavibacteriaceae bacterium]
MKILRFVLIPFVPIFAVIVKLRNILFETNFFKTAFVAAKVISVGNINVGGSGKTPLVIYLANHFKKENKKVGVLSRGYRRKSKGYVLVSDGENIYPNVESCGDEILLTALECKVPCAVSEKRIEGAKNLISTFGVDTIILDDAFQHRWIKRDIDLLICEQKFLISPDFFDHYLLPAGLMREPFTAIERAHAVIINRKFSQPRDLPSNVEKYFKNKRIFTSYYAAKGFVDIKRKVEYNMREFEGQKSLVVCGIANPYSFFTALKQTNVDTENYLIFGDHKYYTNKEIQKIRKMFYSTNSHSVVTTQKDAVKLTEYKNELDDIDIFYLKIELVMDDEKSFIDFIMN